MLLSARDPENPEAAGMSDEQIRDEAMTIFLAGHETTENMYSSIDLCIAKIERQVRKYKGKLEGMRARPHDVVPLPYFGLSP